MCVIFAKKSWVATKLGKPGAKLGGGPSRPGSKTAADDDVSKPGA